MLCTESDPTTPVLKSTCLSCSVSVYSISPGGNANWKFGLTLTKLAVRMALCRSPYIALKPLPMWELFVLLTVFYQVVIVWQSYDQSQLIVFMSMRESLCLLAHNSACLRCYKVDQLVAKLSIYIMASGFKWVHCNFLSIVSLVL